MKEVVDLSERWGKLGRKGNIKQKEHRFATTKQRKYPNKGREMPIGFHPTLKPKIELEEI